MRFLALNGPGQGPLMWLTSRRATCSCSTTATVAVVTAAGVGGPGTILYWRRQVRVLIRRDSNPLRRIIPEWRDPFTANSGGRAGVPEARAYRPSA